MFKDIAKDIKSVDVLISTNVVRRNGEWSTFDYGLNIVVNDGHKIVQYFTMSLDNCEFGYEKQLLYDLDHDKDYVTEVERDTNYIGYIQYRRATCVERMVACRRLSEHKGMIRDLAWHHGYDIPKAFLDNTMMADDDPMVITFPDYVGEND